LDFHHFTLPASTGAQESRMKILDSLVEMVQLVHGLACKLARHDRDLAQQMKRSSSSTALNGSEGCSPEQESVPLASKTLSILLVKP
jgi:hypothetical protein